MTLPRGGTRRRPPAALLVLVTTLLVATPLTAAELLRADFENQITGQPVGTRGAVFGEPAWSNAFCHDVVRDDVTGSLSLEMLDGESAPLAMGLLRFDLPDTSGLGAATVVYELETLAREADDWFLLITELAGSDDDADFQFCRLACHPDGRITVTDQAHTTETVVGHYTTDVPLHVAMVLDHAAGTCRLLLDDVEVLAARPYGTTALPAGSFWLGMSFDEDLLGTYDVDDLVVQTTTVANAATSWGRLKSWYH